MGNFSRNTFDPTKNYVAVRLQQGVPLVDADWNESQDVNRQEVYEGLRAAQPDVARRGGLDLTVVGTNDVELSPGSAVADGRPLQVWAPLLYSAQRYADEATAATDGVAPVAPVPLTHLPFQELGFRTDNVYLDAFEREVSSPEDAALVNPAVGIETATRRRREVVLRVAEGNPVPAPLPGHVHFPVARLLRVYGPLLLSQIVDVKPYALPLGAREIGFGPWVESVADEFTATNRWTLVQENEFPAKFKAVKYDVEATGVVRLDLPHGARLIQLRLRGTMSVATNLWTKLVRSRHDFSGAAAVAEDFIQTVGAFDRLVHTAPAESVVDNARNHYFLQLYASGGSVEVHGGAVLYVP